MKVGRVVRLLSWVIALTLGIVGLGQAQQAANLIPFWDDREPDSGLVVNHAPWQSLLSKYLDDQHASGINRFDYASVARGDLRLLDEYLDYLQSLDPRQLNALEQKAYWINLYNCVTVKFVLVENRNNLRSIRQIRSGFLTPGPWQREALQINFQQLSLDDIQHGILRPIWQDNRVHYALSSASLGSPNLLKTAFTGANVESLLEKATSDFVAHPRAVQISNGRLVLSEIYDLYAGDFGTNFRTLKEHIKKYALPEMSARLDIFNRAQYAHDWDLNRP
jgi:hypothetical protein